MSCLAFLEKMSRHLDGALSVSESQALQAHLSKCENCRQQWAILQQLDSAFSLAPAEVPPADFVSKLNSRLDALAIEQGSPAGTSRGSMFLLLGLGIVSFVALSVILGPILDLVTGGTVLGWAVKALALGVSVVNLLWRMVTYLWDYANSTGNQVFVAGFSLTSLLLTVVWARLVSSLSSPRRGDAINGLS